MSKIETPREAILSVADELSRHSERLAVLAGRAPCAEPLPSRHAVAGILEDFRALLFPGYFGAAENGEEILSSHVTAHLDLLSRKVDEQVRRAHCFACSDPDAADYCRRRASETVQKFLESLPEIQKTLLDDVVAAYEGDPACTSTDEAILAYPGIYALMCQRIAHVLFELEVPVLPRMITEIAHGETGIDIHPGAKIGKRFFIDHGTGVVIGETCIIGDRVRLYQGVTLGAKSFPLDEAGRPVKGIPRHPIIEDDVIIYSGATILGRVTIGRESVIGGNVWLTRSVPPGTRVSQGSARYDAFHSGSGI
jgi:serine O-acetyltransferase